MAQIVFTVEVDDRKFAQQVIEDLGWDIDGVDVIVGRGPIRIAADQELIDHPRPTIARVQAIFWEAYADAGDADAAEWA